MEYILNYWAWFTAGAILMLLEFFIPGLVVIFLGLGAWATAGMLYARLISDACLTIVFFVVTSIFMLATLRRLVVRFYPTFTEKAETDEHVLIAGQSAETISLVSPDHFEGRVKYAGTTWPARSVSGEIEAGLTVAIVRQENISLVVKRAE